MDRYTLQELRKVMIYGRPGFIPDHIVTLDEFMYYFGYRQLTFAIELKENGVEADPWISLKATGLRINVFSHHLITVPWSV